jgi:hypothetical protein
MEVTSYSPVLAVPVTAAESTPVTWRPRHKPVRKLMLIFIFTPILVVSNFLNGQDLLIYLKKPKCRFQERLSSVG